MTNSESRLSVIKRAKPVVRDSVLMSSEVVTHPLIEKTARAISDWHSEYDWPLHVDKAIRAIEVIAENLSREGYRDAKDYLRSAVWKEPKHRTNPERSA